MLKLFRVFMEDSFRQMLYSINVLLILMSERHSFHVMFIFYSKKDIFKPIWFRISSLMNNKTSVGYRFIWNSEPSVAVLEPGCIEPLL